MFIDQPDVDLTISASLQERAYGNTSEIGVSLSIPPSSQAQQIHYLIFLKGPRFEKYTYPNTEDSIGNCPVQVQVIHDPNPSCTLVKVSNSSSKMLDGTNQVLTGTLEAAANQKTWVNVHLDVENAGWSSVVGKRDLFSLPAIGTIYLPIELRATATDVAGIGAVYVPQSLTTYLVYRDLQSLEQVETATPPLLLSDSLVWSDSTGSTIRASGSTINLAAAEAATNATFLIGVLAGALPGLCFGLLELIWRRRRSA